MTAFNEVLQFGREYINRPLSRTRERKSKIREGYIEKFGRKMRGQCPLCYIEAILEILKYDPMAAKNYKLKRGVIAVQFFGQPDKTITPANLTDERGDWVMKHHPEKLVYFDIYPHRPISQKGIRKVAKPAAKPPPKQVITPRNEVLQSKLDALNAVNAAINQPPEYDEVKPEIKEEPKVEEKKAVTKPKTTAKRKTTKKKTTVKRNDSFGN